MIEATKCCNTGLKWFCYFLEFPVKNMLAVMDKGTSASDAPRTPETAAQNEEFLQTGRTGRRNALPDIMGSNVIVTTSSDLPGKLESLTTKDPVGAQGEDGAGPSKS